MEPAGNDEQRYFPVPYHMKHIKMIKNLANRKGRSLAPRRAPTVFNLLRNNKDPLNQMERSGVYKILTKDLNTGKESAYVGVTTRSEAKRVEEHKNDIAKGKLTTSLAIEAYDKDLSINWEQTKVIRQIIPRTQPIIAESIEIIKRSEENLINDKLAWESPQAWRYTLSKEKYRRNERMEERQGDKGRI